ncbi:unnamed protein product [Miscanthus lutarioriparius]|uniref:Uncharacterized protein n=1 Tax=Miscanthus lutarioriparius TaxID=422564 RepID=A0A811Q0S9_9POAL|nr:unnamed protein product [Miscanthus lutarioriparius]
MGASQQRASRPVLLSLAKARLPDLCRLRLSGFLSCNIMVSRPVVLVFLLVILIVTSQFEWKQQLVNELESKAHNQKHVSSREELVKDQIIFTQEKMIQKLNNFIQNLQQQLLQCRGNNRTVNPSGTSLTSYISEIQRPRMMDD